MEKRIPILKMFTFGMLPSTIKKIVYRLQGNCIGHNVHFSLGSVILCKSKFVIGNDSKVGFFTSIVANNFEMGNRSTIRSAVVINAYKFQIGNDVSISETAIIRAGHLSKQSEFIADDLVHVFPSTIIDPSRKIHLKQECAVGPRCSIFTHGSYKNLLEGYPVTYGNVEIGERVELTYNVFVAPGVTIGDDAIIAYGSYVNKNIPTGVLAAGCPAIIRRKKDDFVKELSFDEKVYMMNNLINEFLEYLTSEKIINTFQENENNWFYKTKKHSWIIKLDNQNAPHLQLRLEEASQKFFTNFDLYNYTCDNLTCDMATLLRRYLSRYGIRFKVVE